MLLISKTELTFEKKQLLFYLLYERIFLTNFLKKLSDFFTERLILLN